VPALTHRLELDLDVFAGPFDLLLSLVLREELDLLEVELAEVVLAYLDHLESRDELDLEAATEFLVLIAALLELKSRLMLPGEEVAELDELAPAEAAEELLARMLEAKRYRGAAAHLAERQLPPPLVALNRRHDAGAALDDVAGVGHRPGLDLDGAVLAPETIRPGHSSGISITTMAPGSPLVRVLTVSATSLQNSVGDMPIRSASLIALVMQA